MPHVLQWQLSFLLALRGCQLGTPLRRAPARSPLPPLLFVWYSERAVCSIAISPLFIMVQTYEEIPHACLSVCLSACLPVFPCARACVWGRSTCSVASARGASRACDAVRAGWGHSTSSVDTSPERMRASPFWAPRNRCERGSLFQRASHTRCQHPTSGLDVRNGRFVQSPEVGLPSHSRAFSCRH